MVTRLLVSLALLLIAVRPGAAQSLRVSVRDAVDSVPVVRALVTLRRDSGGTPLHGLTDQAGLVTFRLPAPGAWSVSVRRIGLEPHAVAARMMREGELIGMTVGMRRLRFTLPATRIVAAAGDCARANLSHERTSALWEQVTLALRMAVTAERDRGQATPLSALSFDRELDRTLHVLSETPTQIRRGLGRPFRALHPDSLATGGYVRAVADVTLEYFAPDETSLLSEAFVETHCFDTPAADANPALAELRFWPAPSQRAPDVAGTAYVDTVSGALRHIAFRYVNAGNLFPEGTTYAGGDVRFAQLSNGEWIVAGWSIRMPRMVRVAWARSPRLSGYHEVGGTVDTLSIRAPESATVSIVRVIPHARPPVPPARLRETTPRLATGDHVVVGGKLVVPTSGPAPRAHDWRMEFAARRRAGVGMFRDSTDLPISIARSAFELLQQFSAISLFIVPDGVPAPPRSGDVDLVEGWSAGAPLPVMLPVGAARASGQCHVKLFLDAERTSAAALRSRSHTDIAAMEFYARPQDVPANYRRSGNICGTVLLWSKS